MGQLLDVTNSVSLKIEDDTSVDNPNKTVKDTLNFSEQAGSKIDVPIGTTNFTITHPKKKKSTSLASRLTSEPHFNPAPNH